MWGGDSHLVPQHPNQLLRDPSGGSGRKTGLAGALLLQLTSDLMPVGFLASPYVYKAPHACLIVTSLVTNGVTLEPLLCMIGFLH